MLFAEVAPTTHPQKEPEQLPLNNSEEGLYQKRSSSKLLKYLLPQIPDDNIVNPANPSRKITSKAKIERTNLDESLNLNKLFDNFALATTTIPSTPDEPCENQDNCSIKCNHDQCFNVSATP